MPSSNALVRTAGLEPARAMPNGFSYQLRLSPPPMWRLWSGLSLHPGVAAVGAARLVSTPSRRRAWLGITSEGFPEFEQFCIPGFPESTQLGLSPLRLPVSPRPHAMTFITRAGLAAKVSGPDEPRRQVRSRKIRRGATAGLRPWPNSD